MPPVQSATQQVKGYHYNSDENLQKRVVNIIAKIGNFVRAGDILTKMQEYEPGFAPKLSPAFTALKDKGELKNYSSTGSRRDTYWGLAEWELPIPSTQKPNVQS